MSLIQIHEGTARGDNDLCKSCRHCHRFRTVEGAEVRRCFGFGPAVALRGRVASCNYYTNAALPMLHDLKDIAWEITSKGERGDRRIGFISPEDRRRAGVGFNAPPQPGW